MTCMQFGFDVSDVTGEMLLGAESKLQRWREGNGCGLRGRIEMHKVDGEFHIAMGRATEQIPNYAMLLTARQKQTMGHVHLFDDDEIRWFNSSHIINHLAFADIKTRAVYGASPLDGTRQINPSSPQDGTDRVLHRYLYNLLVVPVIRMDRFGRPSYYYEYTYTLEDTPVVASPTMKIQPGVFFRYSISPYHVVQDDQRPGIREAINHTLAIVGGIAVIASFFFSLGNFFYCNMNAFVDSLSHPRGVHRGEQMGVPTSMPQYSFSNPSLYGDSVTGGAVPVPQQNTGMFNDVGSSNVPVPKSKSYISQSLGLASHID